MLIALEQPIPLLLYSHQGPLQLLPVFAVLLSFVVVLTLQVTDPLRQLLHVRLQLVKVRLGCKLVAVFAEGLTF